MKLYFKYIPVTLDRRGRYYPSHQVKISALEWKAVIYDESNYPLKSSNTIYEYGFIDIIDETILSDIQDLLTTIWVTVWMKEITAEEMRWALSSNWYSSTWNIFEIVPAGTDEISGEITPAITLEVI